jgi:glycosyltransferase involved in cell wall biosynthesis
MNRLAVTLIAKNEERNLPRVLASVRDVADELVVVDSGSSDRTAQIAAAHGARIFARIWSGFADQRNFAGAQCACEWVLALDADEELSPGLCASLLKWKKAPAEFDAYEFARCASYLGRWIRHSGWYPDRKTRLYRRGSGPSPARHTMRFAQPDRLDGYRATFFTTPSRRPRSTKRRSNPTARLRQRNSLQMGGGTGAPRS